METEVHNPLILLLTLLLLMHDGKGGSPGVLQSLFVAVFIADDLSDRFRAESVALQFKTIK